MLNDELSTEEQSIVQAMSEVGKITSDQIDSVVDTLASSAEANPKTQILRSILDGTRDEKKLKLEVFKEVDKEQNSQIRGLTAKDIIIDEMAFKTQPVIELECHDEISEMPEDLSFLDAHTATESVIGTVGTASNFSNTMQAIVSLTKEAKPIHSVSDLSDEDAMALFETLNKYKLTPTMDVLELLPPKLQAYIKVQAKQYGLTSKKQVESFSKLMLEQFANEINMDKEFATLQTNLNDAMAIPQVIDMYSEYVKENMEQKLHKQADLIKEKHPEKADEIMRISQAYTDAYTLIRQNNLIASNPRIISSIRKNCAPKLFDRHCDHFDFKTSKTKFKVPKIKELIPALVNIFGTSHDLATRYVYILCKVCENLPIDKLENVWFMYSSVNNIMSLAQTSNSKTDFSKVMMSTIKGLLDLIQTEEDADCDL